jgi:phosphoglycerate dehydrogenase-like enzyme
VSTAFKMVFLPPQRQKTREWAEAVGKAVPEATVVVAEDRDEALREIPNADALFGTLDQELLARAQQLRWLAAPAIAPPAGYYFRELVEHPCTATNFRGIFNEHIAAHILAFVLAFARGFHYYFPRQMRHEYRPEPLDTGTVYLPESTALILGVGGIGAEAAKYLAQLGVSVIGVDGRVESAPTGVSELHRPDQLDALLPRANFVILTVPHTPETEGLFNAERFGKMRKDAFFINIGRGMTTKLDDLNAALRDGTIAGAGCPERDPDAAHSRLRTVPGRPPPRPAGGERQAVRGWPAIGQPGRQVALVLEGESGDHSPATSDFRHHSPYENERVVSLRARRMEQEHGPARRGDCRPTERRQEHPL